MQPVARAPRSEIVIKKLREQGASIAEISARINVSVGTVKKALRRMVSNGEMAPDLAKLPGPPAQPNLDEEVIRLRGEGVKVKDMAARLSMTEEMVRHRIRRLGRLGLIKLRHVRKPRPSTTWNREHDDELILLRSHPKSLTLIAARFGTSETTIRRQLKRLIEEGRIEANVAIGSCWSKRLNTVGAAREQCMDEDILRFLDTTLD
jgi:predicted ArsR family transcriptional regulator